MIKVPRTWILSVSNVAKSSSLITTLPCTCSIVTKLDTNVLTVVNSFQVGMRCTGFT